MMNEFRKRNIEHPTTKAEQQIPGKFRCPLFNVRCSMFLALTLAFLAICNSAFAEKILLRDAIVHTVSGETLSPGEVLIDGAKILGVGANVNSDGAKIISLKG